MRATKIVAPDGRSWTVRRRWLPRMGTETVWGRFHRRFRKTMRRMGDAADADPGCLDLFGEGLVAGILVILGLLLVIFVLLPLLVAVVDILVVLLLAVLGVVGRVVLRRPWTVEASTASAAPLTWKVVGWRTSGDKIAEVADLLAVGITPPTEPVPERR